MPEQTVAFHGTLHAGRHDREGQWTVTFTVPSSELPSILRLCTWTERLLRLKIEVVPENKLVTKGRFTALTEDG